MKKNIKFPCWVGDKVYVITEAVGGRAITEKRIKAFEIRSDEDITFLDESYSEYLLSDFNKTWFITSGKALKAEEKLNKVYAGNKAVQT